MQQHYLEIQKEQHRLKIERHLGKYIDVNSPLWLITSGTFQKLSFKKIGKKIRAYHITTLILSTIDVKAANNLYSHIIKDIGGATFNYLINISKLANNCIVSVEPLLQFVAPCLEALYLDKNLLTSLRSLRKFVENRLKILDLSMNHLSSIAFLPEFDCPSLNHLILSRNERITIFEPFLKSNLNPKYLSLNKVGFLSPHCKRQYIDNCFRPRIEGQSPKTKM